MTADHDNPGRVAAPGDAPSDHDREAAERRDAQADDRADDPGPVPARLSGVACEQYLGHAVYADFDGRCFVLSTRTRFGDTNNHIILEPEVYEALVNYVARIRNLMSGAHP